jgi:PAS domain S-box-containing protein
MNTTPSPKTFRILIVDDNPAIHDDIRKILGGSQHPDPALAAAKSRVFGRPAPPPLPYRFDLESAFQGEEAEAMVRDAVAAGRPYAMAFVDVRMPPGLDGIETIGRLWELAPDLQVVLCTAYSDYSWQDIFQKLGRPDSLVILKKPFDNIEVSQIAHTLTEKWHLTRLRDQHLNELDLLVEQRTAELRATHASLVQEAEERLRAERSARVAEARFVKAFVASPTPLAILSVHDGHFVSANQAFQELTGYRESELLAHTPQELGLWSDSLSQPWRTGAVRNLPVNVNTKTESVREVLLTMEVFEDEQAIFQIALAQDMTELQRLQRQFMQAQKMEAVGQLAAGVGQDFNNILQIIQGYTGMLNDHEALSEGGRKYVQRITEAANRAAGVVRQLLSISRENFIQPGPVRMGEILAALAEILPRLLPEHITIDIDPEAELPVIRADESQIQQVLMNLAVNARDAMPSGGRLSIRARMEEARHPEDLDKSGPPAQFLHLSVADTGCGMAPEVLARVFEPFFAVKGLGKGTGLRLSMVYGIMKQHGGWVTVDSEPGRGTCFHLFLPLESGPRADAGPEAAQVVPSDGQETILVVEDEPGLRAILAESLRAQGYRVLQAGDGPKALAAWGAHRGEVDLVLTDLLMPGGMTGQELAERLLTEDPSLKIVYTSGYTAEALGEDLANFQNYRCFFRKPYDIQCLLGMIRKCLNETSWQLP